MGTLQKLGRKLEEATVKRQGQVLPTENEAWGFYGTMSRYRYDLGDLHDMQGTWRMAFAALMNAFPGAPSKAIRKFLDSKPGRHFGDAVTDAFGGASAEDSPIDSKVLGKAIKEVLGSARDGAWIRKAIAEFAGIPIDAQAGSTGALVDIMKALNAAWDDVRSQEAKKNWKQQGQAMHQLEKHADALVTATRAWFTNSGRAQTYEISAGGAKGQPYRKVRVTIPEDKE
jgi:hypothetical protein